MAEPALQRCRELADLNHAHSLLGGFVAVEGLQVEHIVQRVADTVGAPRNYGLSEAEQAALVAEKADAEVRSLEHFVVCRYCLTHCFVSMSDTCTC